MTKYEFIWKLIKLAFIVGIVVTLLWLAVQGNGIAIGVLFSVVALGLVLTGAIGALYAGRVHNGLILDFLRMNAEENKLYIKSMRNQLTDSSEQAGGLIVDSNVEVIE